MLLHELDYDLPAELIAQHPATPRDAARLLVVHRASGRIEHRVFRDIVDYLRPGDCMVLNNTRVIPARVFCRRKTGGRVEMLFVRDADASDVPVGTESGGCPDWLVLLRPSGRITPGDGLDTGFPDVELEVLARLPRGQWRVRPVPYLPALEFLSRAGHTPLPPYIQRAGSADPDDAQRYQTVYAARPGAVAAPTAGLHFTPELFGRIQAAGVQPVEITLHVGPGTFLPVECEDLREHAMHAEWYEISAGAAAAISLARAQGRRVIAVGTTAARTLESLCEGPLIASSGWTDVFIHPPYAFRRVDALLTNFHLPRSTLLALVMAFAGIELAREAYRTAIEQRYRFYSYGDSMLIL